MRAIQIVYYVVIGLVILGALLVFVSTLFICTCSKFQCRYILYFGCSCLAVLGIVTFLFTIIFSLITPALYISCHYIQGGMESPQGFIDNFGPIINDDATTQALSTCATGGSG